MYQDDKWEVKFSIYIFDLTQAGGSFFFDSVGILQGSGSHNITS